MLLIGEAGDGEEALELLGRTDWDVAVVDYSMPGKSGIELVKDIKRAYPRRSVLVLSMHPEEFHAEQVIRAGGSGYLNKEAAGEELIHAIRSVARGGTYVSQALAERLAGALVSGADKPPHETLSDREYRVLWLLACGKQIKEIAREMSLSPSTVSACRLRILRHLKLANNAELVLYAVKHRLVR
jgi:DNA-binding NarL/FixJ family response regulator